MQEEGEVKVVGNKLCCFKSKAKSVELLLKGVANCKAIKEAKIMHSQALTSLVGIEQLQMLTIACLSSNSLSTIEEIIGLKLLTQLDVKSNRIVSLRGIEGCQNLVRIDASHNLIEGYEGLTELSEKNKIEVINLSGNRIKDCGGMVCFSRMKMVVELIFERGKAINPMCLDREQYVNSCRKYLCTLPTLEKLDELNKSEIQTLLHSDHQPPSEQEHYPQHILASTNPRILHPRAISTYHTQQDTLLGTHNRLKELEDVVNFKEEIIGELRSKNSQLELVNAQQYKEGLKRENEIERLYGQVLELGKSVDMKDGKINELHRRIEETLKANANYAKTIEIKGEEMEKLRKEINELKIESAEYKMLSKDQERRLSELQNKALANIEDRATRAEELRHKYEELQQQTREQLQQHEEAKDRIRELTQLLREWESKYEHKLTQLESQHRLEKEQLIQQHFTHNQQSSTKHREELTTIQEKCREEVLSLEEEYTTALNTLTDKHEKLKRAYEEKCASEHDVKVFVKSLMGKNSEQEGLIKEFQDLLVRSKKELQDYVGRNDSLSADNTVLTNRLHELSRKHHEELSKLSYERNSFDKQLQDLRKNQIQQEDAAERLAQREKQLTKIEERLEELTTTLEAKNVMLDDKNDTIEGLKLELENLQNTQAKLVDSEEHETLQKKYNKNKEKLKELTTQVELLTNDNQELEERNQELEERVGALENEFNDIKELMGQQETNLGEKGKQIDELVLLLTECKQVDKLQKEEIDRYRREVERMGIEAGEKERKWRKAQKDRELEVQEKFSVLEAERDRYVKIANKLKELEGLTKNLPT